MASIHKTYTNLALLLCLTLLLAQTVSAQFTKDDWSDFTGGAKAVCDDELDDDATNDDIDDDDDGLIELCYLEDVDAMRHDLEGASLKRDGGTLSAGCPSDGCDGYELVRDLDFNDADSYITTANKVTWTKGTGWPTIGEYDEAEEFACTLEGNGYGISSLFMYPDTNADDFTNFGFILYLSLNGRIQNLYLSNINIMKATSSGSVAALVGEINEGTIINSFVQGKLIFLGTANNDTFNSLVSQNWGIISNSYVNILTEGYISALFSLSNDEGTISDSYAIGDINKVPLADGYSYSFIDQNGGTISNVYHVVDIEGDVRIGQGSIRPLAVGNSSGQITNSYWNSTKWKGLTRQPGNITNVSGFTTTELQGQTTPSAVNTQPYYKWSKDNWDFGTESQYPALKYAEYAPGDTENIIDNLACGKSQQPKCGTLLKGQRNNQPRIISPRNNLEILISEDEAGTTKTISVTVEDTDVDETLTLFLSAEDEDQKLVMLETARAEILPDGNAERGINKDLIIEIPEPIMLGRTTLRLVARDNSARDNASSEPVFLTVVVVNTKPTVTATSIPDVRLPGGTNTTLNVVIKDADKDMFRVRFDTTDAEVATAKIIETNGANHIVEITALNLGTAEITLTVDDGKDAANSRVTIKFMVVVKIPAGATTWDKFSGGAKAACDNEQDNDLVNDDIDEDNDGLIELCYLEDVDAMRHVLDGSGYQSSPTATKLTAGCPLVKGQKKCKGYELVRDLDFNEDASYRDPANKVIWMTDTGWPMIEGTFSSTLEGNGHTISNLFINQEAASAGFIRNLSGKGRIRNLGLPNVNMIFTPNVSEPRASVLVARTNSGVITNCYVQGKLNILGNFDDNTYRFYRYSALVSINQGTVSNSYVNTSVEGSIYGLFCSENTGTISDSYAIGDASEIPGTNNNYNPSFTLRNRSKISDIYHVVYFNTNFSGPLLGGALARDNLFTSGQISSSYWDQTEWKGFNRAAFGRAGATETNSNGFTTTRLQQPTTPSTVNTQPYYEWSKDNWDFGTESQYPSVRYARGTDTDDPACRKLEDEEQSQQPVCGTLLRGQRNNQPRIIFPTADTEITIKANEENTTKTISVTVADDDITDKLTLLLSAVDTKQNIVKLETIKATVLPNGKVVRDTNKELVIRTSEEIISDETMLQLIVEDNSGSGNPRTSVLFKVKAIGNAAPTVMPIDNISLLEGTTTTLVVGVEDVDGDSISVTVSSENPTTATATIEPAGDENYTLGITGLSEGAATITVTANDGRGKSNSTATETFTVTVEANQAPTISIAELNQRLQVNDMVELTVSVSDANFDVNDKVTLNVESSAPSVVSVDQSEVIVTGDDTDKVFTLSAHAGGDATITISAKDSKEVASNSEMVSLHVNAPPTIESYDNQVTLKEGRVQSINVTVSDVNINDALTLRLTSPSQDVVELVTETVPVPTNKAATRDTQAFRIKGLEAGDTTLNIVAEDADTMAEASVDVTVRPNAMPTLTIVSDLSDLEQLLEGTSKTLVVMATDADDDPADLTVSVTSNNPAVVSTPGAVDGNNYSFVITAEREDTATIEISVDDGNSQATETFEAVVEANVKPTVEIRSQPNQRIESGTTTNVVISIRDANFDVNDSVRLEAKSSTASVVSVTPEKVNIGSDTNQTFRLTGKAGGESNISFTATDINGEQSTVSVLLSVFSSLTTSTTVPTDPVIVPLGVAYSLDTKPFFTQSGSGISYAATGLPNGLTFTDGVISGTPTTASTNTDVELVKVTASDGRGGSAEATFTLLINAEPTVAAVTIKAINVNTWRLTATVDFEDKNGRDETKTRYQWFRAGPGDPPNYTGVQSGPEDTYMILNNNTGRAGGTRYKVEVTFVDNIGQSVTKSSAIYMIDNEAPMIKAISQRLENEDGIVNGDGTVNEGGTVSITANVEDLNRDELNYRWRVTSKGENPPRTLTSATSNNGQFSFDVPANWIKDTSADNTTRTLSLKIVASDSSLSDTQTAEVVVTKVNNGPLETAQTIAKIDRNGNVLTLKTGTDTQAIAADPDNPDDNTVSPATTYQWQWCQSSCSSSGSWDDINLNAAGVTYTIPGTISGTPTQEEHRFRIKISYTDGQGYTDNTIFTNNLPKDPSADIRVRAKVFLEGPLQ